MVIYLFLLIVSTGFAFSYMGQTETRPAFESIRRLLGFMFLITLIVLYIWRGVSVGTDYPMYNMFLTQPSTYLKGVGVESGYVWLYGIAWQRQWPLFVTIVSFFMTYLGMYLFSRRAKIALPMYLAMNVITIVYMSSFNVVRQMAAIGICYIGLTLFIDDDDTTLLQRRFWIHYVVFVIGVLIAFKFHASAIIALALPFCKFIRMRPWMGWSGFVLTMFGLWYGLGNQLVPVLVRFFPHYLAKYSSGNIAFFNSGSKDIVAIIPILVQFVILLIIMHYDKPFIQKYRWVTMMYLIYLTFYTLSGSQAAGRVQMYWLPFLVYFYCLYIQDGHAPIAKASPSFMKLFIVVFFILYTLLRIVTNNSGVYPYLFR